MPPPSHPQALVLEVVGSCAVNGTLDVSGGAGSPGQERYSGGGGGAGGGAVKLTCGGALRVTISGSVRADGGDGGRANLGSLGALAGLAGVGVAGGFDGGRGSRWGCNGGRDAYTVGFCPRSDSPYERECGADIMYDPMAVVGSTQPSSPSAAAARAVRAHTLLDTIVPLSVLTQG